MGLYICLTNRNPFLIILLKKTIILIRIIKEISVVYIENIVPLNAKCSSYVVVDFTILYEI